MTPRPRKASDEEVFAAAYRAMTRLGPSQLTLAEIAREAGLTAGALVQRFGSKRQLMLTLVSRAAGSTEEMFATLRAAYDSPLDALFGYADCFSEMADSPAALAQNLAYLQTDFTDPEFHRHALAQARATRDGFRALLDEAVEAGELVAGTDTRLLARVVQTTLSGALMTWGFYQEGPVAAWARTDLEAVLRPHRVARRRRKGRRDAGTKGR